METIAPHIEYLLQHRQCVILPGLGAFIATEIPARIEPAAGTIEPPHREICFNASVRNDDGLLASSLTRRLQIGFEAGRSLMLSSIEALRAALLRDGEVTIGRIGTLLSDSEGNLRFTPLQDPASSCSGMGLAPVDLRSLRARASHKAGEQAASQSAADFAVTAAASGHSGPVSNGSGRDRSRNYYIAISRRAVRAAAILLLVIGVALSVILPRTTAGIDPAATVNQASVLPLETIMDGGGKSETRADRIVPPAKAEADSTLVQGDACSPTHYLIVGTFRDPAEAERFVKANRAPFELTVVPSPTLTRVSACSSNTPEALTAVMKDPDFRANFKGAWIWTKR